MLFKLIVLAYLTVSGAYGFVEVLFLENLNWGLKSIGLLLCVAMFFVGYNAFRKNWDFYCDNDYEYIQAERELKREYKRAERHYA